MLRRSPYFNFLLVTSLVFGIFLEGCAGKTSQVVQAAQQQATPTPIPQSVAPRKPTYPVQRGDIAKEVKLSGRIVPVVERQLYFREPGRIDKVLVKKNDVVKKDQLLAEYETGGEEYELQRARVNLEIAHIDQQLTELNTSKWAADYNLIMELKKRQVELAQINVDEIQNKIEGMRVVAPFDGTVLVLTIDDGSLVEAYNPVAVVADLSKLELSVDPQGTDFDKLAKGMPAAIDMINKPGTVLHGVIRRLPYITNNPNLEDHDRTLRISLDEDPITAGYELDDLVRAQVVLESKKDILWLPPQAIRTFEGRNFVVIQDGQGQRRVDVELGIQAEDKVEIVSGLEEGQIAIAP
jgi:membrane fusion protein, macrolide-specific efflux system